MTDHSKMLKSVSNYLDFNKTVPFVTVGIVDPIHDAFYEILLLRDSVTDELYIPRMVMTEHGFKKVNDGN